MSAHPPGGRLPAGGSTPRTAAAPAGADLRLLRAAVFAAVCVVLSASGHVLASCAGVPLWALVTGFLAVFAAAVALAGRERTLPGIAGGLAVAQLALHALFRLAQHLAATQHLTAAQARPRRLSDGALFALAVRVVCGGDGVPPRLTAEQARWIVTASGIAPSGTLPHGSGAGGHSAHGMGRHTAVHQASDALAPSAAASPLPPLGDVPLPSLPMLLAHLLAAVALGLLLRRGEQALFRLVRLSARGVADGVAEGVAEGALVRSLRAALTLVRALRTGLPGAPGGLPLSPGIAPAADRNGPRCPALAHSVGRRGPPRRVPAT
ncbi:hypothetical protein [Streptomyces sp. NPDC051776]|uniref:hypothetical protein n=1 Tax=Streptomyces sp. NPDC051776 TaxID=3155414 RepID=UPI003432A66E